MRKILTTLLASGAIVAFAPSAMAECSFGHTKQVMASTVDDEAATMSTHDGDVMAPGKVAEADEASVIAQPTDDDEKSAE
jgi:hypothetical protein